ncbi:toll/interleukin-1 receptor domain-containing protein [Paenibacillus cucumis (ex Kampfer et al. 2016)]|uniref:Toll/interleukin-1 receptor domain-containing protein n=1 Tax=Paenibacillus cucumis (ex Kampfer et al. 2016) TaxID=1776858 RepID=A0ABS7KRK1_9BACL|nr:toll/interleukin-1 receptor domain-containing protein [Paenibacillus cucumis (ex Kampfer et al. 2016)]MBY0206785.1 toll/interleukin-1 receptor domain-containing protein [Paenibacillus cucumis (ex Kampfer et al. 2016)]
MPKIFISHASVDERFVTPLVDFLQSQFSLVRDDFFYTSDEELNPGEDWVNAIEVGMKEANLIIPIITPNYMESQFCLCELGAAWINNKNLVPVVIPPLDYRALQSTPYRSKQVITLNSRDGLNRLFDAFTRREIGKGALLARFLKRTERFQKDHLEPFVKEMEKRKTLTAEMYGSLERELESANQAFSEADDEVMRLKSENEQLRRMKDAVEIQALDDERMDEWDTLIQLADEVRKSVKSLNKLTKSVLFYSYNNQGFTLMDQNENSRLDALKREGKLKWEDEKGWIVDEEDHTMSTALENLNKVDSHISNFDYVLKSRFNREYPGTRYGLEFFPFWEVMFKIEIYTSE